MSTAPEGASLRSTLLSFRTHKRNQGRLVRQLTAAILSLVVFFGCWTLSQGPLSNYVNTYVRATASYPGLQADPALDAQLDQFAETHGLEFERDDIDRGDRKARRRYYLAPASRYWSATTEAVRDARQAATNFADEATEANSNVSVRHDPNLHTRPAYGIRYGIPLTLFALGLWFAFRIVHYPRFADFLISVDAEMDKVSWPSRQDLFRNTVVVITTMFFLGAVLFAYDVFWVWLFQSIGILRDAAP